MTFTVPIFHDDALVGFSCCMAHWPDVGGTLREGTTDIFSEGLQMPIVKIYRKGVPNEELIAIIKNNVRLPERAMGDFRAQIAAVKTGERRFLDLIRKYGCDAVLGGIAFTSLSSGAHHISGLDAGGTAYCWGLNIGGQIGISGGVSCNGPL